jgi:hypothetical protein
MSHFYRSTRALTCFLTLALPACALPGDGDGDGADTSEATSALSGGWSGMLDGYAATWQAPQVVNYNGDIFGMFAGNCGGNDCIWGHGINRTQVHWAQLTNGSFPYDADIPNQTTHDRVNAIQFNGYLYMVHDGGDDDNVNTTWISRWDRTSHRWTADQQITYPSFNGPPALAVFNNRLYFIGSYSSSPYRMWYGSMGTDGVFSSMFDIPGHESASQPSATVAFGQLFFTHRWGATSDLVYGTFDGTTWSPVQHIYGGTNNGPLQGLHSAIAYDGRLLHLVHRRYNDSYLWWTTYDGCNWATSEGQLGGQRADLEPSLTATPTGVLMTAPHYLSDSEEDYYGVDYMTYTKPLTIIRCTIGLGGIK